MKIAVCVKQVPTVSKIGFDYQSKTIIREGVPLEVNVFDLIALGRAVGLKEEVGAEVTAITMGPPQAKDALAHCLAAGAHHAILISDGAMAGSDTLATSRTLALVLKDRDYDLILCGRNSTDAETGQVGPQVAEILSIPHVSRVRKLDYLAESNSIVAERVTDEGSEVIQCALPALVTATEGLSEEPWPRRQAIAEARERPMEDVTASQLSSDTSLFGSDGSPTWVADIRLIEPQRLARVIEESNPEEAARRVAQGLKEKPAPPNATIRRQWSRFPGQKESALWVVGEKVEGQLRWATFEILGKARELAEELRCQVVAVLVEGDSQQDISALASYGADHVLILNSGKKLHPTSPSVAQSLAQAVKDRNPYAVLVPSTGNGRDLASRVAARLSLGLTGDCIDLEIDGKGRLVQLKPALGGNVVAPILSKTRPYLATLRPGILTPIDPQTDATVTVERLAQASEKEDPLRVLESHREGDAMGVQLEQASVVLGVGMGIGGPENLPTVYKLAEKIGATVAASRNVTDAGWLPKQVQVGLTGRAIAPELYIAVGLRGAFNHMVGIQKAGTIVAINNNPRHPIFQGADVGIVGDWQTYLPPLVDALVLQLSSCA